MRWIHTQTPAPQEALEIDYRSACDLGKVRLGERWLFFPKFSGTAYLPYDQVARVWLRQEEVNARLCCGTANFDQFFLMIEGTDGQLRRAEVENKDRGKEGLVRIPQINPAVQVGKPTQ